ncbi:MAG: hypothetical protein AABX79_03160 [Nanoarchaeota archaeon]
MINLQTKGFEILTQKTRDEFQKLWDEYSSKIERKLKNAESFRIHIKEYSPGGKTKFSIHMLVSYAGKSIEADSSDWDLRRTFHKAFSKMEQEIEHKFHVSDQHKQKR